MPQRKHQVRRLLLRVVFFAIVGWALVALRAARGEAGWDDWADDAPTSEVEERAPETARDDPVEQPARKPFAAARFATSMAFAAIFFAGAAFTAGAGDQLAQLVEDAQCAVEATDAATAETEATADCAAAEESAGTDDAEAAAAEAAEATAPVAEAMPAEPAEAAQAAAAQAASTDAAATPRSGPKQAQPAQSAAAAGAATKAAAVVTTSSRHWVVRRAHEDRAKAPAIEDEGGAAVVWLNRSLPDPTPPALRLSPRFASNLVRVSRAHGVHWSTVLGVLRAEGFRNREPATRRELTTLAKGLRVHGAAKNEWNGVLALSGRTQFADKAVALARYDRAVGLRALVRGLEAEKETLATRLLADARVHMYAGGRGDVRTGKIDVRVIVLVSYLAETFGQVTVSSLVSGHRLYARPGVISAHIPGHAVDIAALAGRSIAGNQQPGGLTERAVRSILLLPTELQPRQVISLLGLGGSSFPLADHADHIHVGF